MTQLSSVLKKIISALFFTRVKNASGTVNIASVSLFLFFFLGVVVVIWANGYRSIAKKQTNLCATSSRKSVRS